MSEPINYNITLEDFNGMTFIHIDVYKWNKSVQKQLCYEIIRLQDEYKNIYAFITNGKLERFAEMFNFQYTGTEVTLDKGDRYPVMRRG